MCAIIKMSQEVSLCFGRFYCFVILAKNFPSPSVHFSIRVNCSYPKCYCKQIQTPKGKRLFCSLYNKVGTSNVNQFSQKTMETRKNPTVRSWQNSCVWQQKCKMLLHLKFRVLGCMLGVADYEFVSLTPSHRFEIPSYRFQIPSYGFQIPCH